VDQTGDSDALAVTELASMGNFLLLSKSATSNALNISEVALLVFGLVLTAGLIGEYAKSERWKRHLKTFEMLVIIGVAGELLADGGIFLFSGHLQTISNSEIAVLSKEAQQFREHAAALELQIADRHVNRDQRTRMVNALHATSGRVAVTFVASSGADSQEYAAEIGDVFREAKWTVVPFPWLTSYEVPLCGFAVNVRNKGSTSTRELLGETAREALLVLDKRIAVTHGGTDPSSELHLDMEVLVGSKCRVETRDGSVTSR
jgi:hypothetical protein